MRLSGVENCHATGGICAMSDLDCPIRREKVGLPRRFLALALERFLVLALLVACALASRGDGQEAEREAVSRLRRVLQTTYSSLPEREDALKECLRHLNSLADLQAAATLTEWESSRDDEKTSALDRANRALVRQRFETVVRQLLHRGEPANVAAMLDMLRRMGERARAGGDPLTFVRGFAPDLAEVVLQGPPPLRGHAARTLVHVEPPVHLAVPVLSELLHADEAEQRRAAADSFALWLQNVLQTASASGVRLRPAQRAELVLTASTIVPAVHDGLADAQPEVRRRCLETIGFACVTLTRLLDDAAANDDPAAQRALDAELEELRPLLLALHDCGPILERSLGDNDPQTRILTHKALEELGVARSRWLRRWSDDTAAADEKLLSELLYEAMPGVAEALTHPDVRVRRSALDVLEMSGSLALPTLPALKHALRDPDRFVRWSAVRTVGKLGPSAAPETRDELRRLLHDPDDELRKAAAHALERLQSTDSTPLDPSYPR
jgi:hypothetical protein